MFHVKINEWLTSLKVDYVRPASVPAYGPYGPYARFARILSRSSHSAHSADAKTA